MNRTDLSTITNIIPGFAFKSKDFSSSGDLVVKIKDIKPPYIDIRSCSRVNTENYDRKKLLKYALGKGDFVVAMTGATIGKVGYHSSDDFLFVNQRVAKFEPKSGIDKKFVYYCVQQKTFTNFILGRLDSSSAQGNISADGIGKFPVPIFEYADQQKIASVLSALDAKIELNNRINTQLEQIAKILYDYWFVQFDFPDKNGKPYKSSGGKMVWSEELKREIPEGWEVKKLNKRVKIGSGYSFKSEDYDDSGQYKVITIKSVQDSSLDTEKTDRIDFIPEKIPPFCILEIGDVLMSLTGNVGRMCFVDEENLLLNQRVGKLLAEPAFVYFGYLFFLRAENRMKLERISGGSSQSNLSPVDAVKIKFAEPESSVMNTFHKKIDPIFQMLIKNKAENQKLAELRNWLLPMLMNGQVTVQ